MAASGKSSLKVNRRSEILQAAEMLMRSRGLTGVTTREISQKVGCSEGALYFHFKGRLEIITFTRDWGRYWNWARTRAPHRIDTRSVSWTKAICASTAPYSPKAMT